jgi:hypothetical protein
VSMGIPAAQILRGGSLGGAPAPAHVRLPSALGITLEALENLYQRGELYRGCDVMAVDLSPAEGQTPHLKEGESDTGVELTQLIQGFFFM